jgi:isoquinoline 1-oxidoreductase subunit beta
MKRRTWLIGTAAAAGGVLAVGVAGLMAREAHFEGRAAQAGTPAAPLLAGWVQVAGDATVTVLVPHADMGQGSLTALAMMVAEELDADWAQVRVAQAPADPAFANRFFVGAFLLKGAPPPAGLQRAAELAFGEAARLANMQVTGGSAAVRFTGQFGLRIAGAAAREMLVAAGAQKLGVPAAELRTRAGRVTHPPTGRSLGYGELAGAAAMLDTPREPTLKQRGEFKLVGTAPPRLDIPAKVTGRTKYGIDVQMPGMLVATVRAAPVHGQKLVQVDDAPALAVKGVRKVLRLPSAVAVVGDGYWAARTALDRLQPVFSKGDSEAVTSASISRQFSDALASGAGKKLSSRGDVAQAEGRVITAAYEVPFLHHATMEPINVTAQWDGTKLRAWGSEQDALGARNNLAQAAGVALDDVEFTNNSLGGGFGRRSAPKKDHLEQAVQIAKAMSPAPVKLVWSREEDFAQGAYRPAIATRIEAKLDAQGRIAAWRQRFIDVPDLINEGYPIPYDVPHQLLEGVPSPTHVRYGAWRSVAHSQHGFFTESFMDELALAAKKDPLDFRREHVAAGSRHRKVLDEVARRSGWGTALPAGRARGVALVESFGSVVAEVIEASLSARGEVQVHRITAVVDCGYVVHADTAVQQVQGGIIMGLSAATAEAITIDKGAVVQRSYPDYPVLQLAQVPPIDVHFIESDGALGGLGEVGLPPVAPALANAVHAASGQRLRTLPLRQSAQSQA